MALSFGWWDHFEYLEGVPFRQQYLDRIELVKLAESFGIERYHVAEHHFTKLDLAPSPLMFLGALAQHTSRIRLASMVLCLPMYQPARLLQEICMVDQLSGGRLELGVGRGARDVDHIWLSSDPLDTRSRYDETMKLLMQGLHTGRLDHHGKHFDYDDVPVFFEPHQENIRFWYAGNYVSAAQNGMSCLGFGGRDDLEQYWRIYAEGRRSGDRRFKGEPRVGSTRHFFVAKTDAEAKAVARHAWAAYRDHFFFTGLEVEGRPAPPAMLKQFDTTDPDELMETGLMLVGSPETVLNRLLKMLERVGPGYNYLANSFQWGDITHQQAKSSLTLFASEVMPKLRQAHGRAGAEAMLAVG